jgi:hypothetical protein
VSDVRLSNLPDAANAGTAALVSRRSSEGGQRSTGSQTGKVKRMDYLDDECAAETRSVLKRQIELGLPPRRVRRTLAGKEFRPDCQTAHTKRSWPSSNSGSKMSLMATWLVLFRSASTTWFGCLRINRPCAAGMQWPRGWRYCRNIGFGISRSETFRFIAAADSPTSWRTSLLGLRRSDIPVMSR